MGTSVAVGAGEAVGADIGAGVGSGVAVDFGVGVAVGSGPTRMDVSPAVIASCFRLSSKTPEKSYYPSSAGAVTVYVTSSAPSRVKMTVCPITDTVSATKSDSTKENPAGRVSLSRAKPPDPEAEMVTCSRVL